MPNRSADSPFIKLASFLALTTALGVAMVPPLSFHLAGTFATRGAVTSEIEFTAKEISRLISENPEYWTFEGDRITNMLATETEPGQTVYFEVTTAERDKVASFPAQSPGFRWPTVQEVRPLKEFGHTVGHLSLTRSLEGLTKSSLLIGVFSSLLAVFVYWALRVVPVRLLKRAWSRLSHMASHDALTGLFNRSHFLERLDKSLSEHGRSGERTVVYSVDFDRFKEVNDTLGHAAGDELLRLAAARMANSVRGQDTLARLGGDEFALFQTGKIDAVQASETATTLIKKLSEPFILNGQETLIGASVGITMSESDGVADADLLLRQADLALYEAKRNGRGVYQFFEVEMDAELTARKALEHDLRRALQDQCFEIHYQPQIDLETRTVLGVEALLRWHDDQRGNVPPTQIIPVIENAGMMWDLTSWILHKACEQTKSWGDLRLAVNLSPSLFQRAGLVDMVQGILQETGFPANRLELELTEEVLVSDADQALRALTQLRGIGVQIAMDDFGTGYSSLGNLRKYPFSRLKIDRAFVHDLDRSESVRTIVGAIVQMGKALGMQVIAEGVESATQLRWLERSGCDEAQGFFFAAPLAAGDVLPFIMQCERARPASRKLVV